MHLAERNRMHLTLNFSQIICQLEEPACWLTAHGTGQKQPSAGRSLFFIDFQAGGLVLLGAECLDSLEYIKYLHVCTGEGYKRQHLHN